MADEPSDSLPETPEEPVEPDKTFSQADLDRIVRDRLARQKDQFKGYDEYKVKAEKFDELEAASKSELEKEREARAAAEQAAEQAAARAQESLLRAAVIAEAAKKNVVDPDAAFALLDKTSVEFDADGSPSNIAEAMDSLLTARPFLVAAAGGSRGSADQGARQPAATAGQLTRADLQKMTDAEIVQAQKDGRFQDVLSGQS